MMSNKITADNFTLIAAKAYQDIAATDQDFQEDLRRFFLIKRLFNQYLKGNELKERLILNHIIVILNCFGDRAVDLLFFELEDYLPQLVCFLILLNRLPDISNDVLTSSIPLDKQVVEYLRQRVNKF